MKSIWTITKRELAGYFNSPVAYVFLVIFLLMTAAFTFLIGQFMDRNQATLQPFFMWHPWIYLFLVPAVGMRLWSEERRQGTMELLLTLPISLWHCIIGKFLASWIFLTLALVMTFPIWITVNYLGDPDNSVIVASYIGSFFLAGAYLSITSMTSAFTRNQVISFILSVVICLFLVLCGWPPVTDVVETLAPALDRGVRRRLQRDARHRAVQQRTDRQPRGDLLFVGDRLPAVRHERHHPRAARVTNQP